MNRQGEVNKKMNTGNGVKRRQNRQRKACRWEQRNKQVSTEPEVVT